MPHEVRRGVAAYLEVFLLIGVAIGGSAIVYGATGSYSKSTQGPATSIGEATIRQGSNAAIERLTVYNSGTTAFNSLTLTTTGVSSSVPFCYSAVNPVTRAVVSSTCPTLSTNPATLQLSLVLQPGGSVVIEITIVGMAFNVGVSYTVSVSTSNGAQSSARVVALPA